MPEEKPRRRERSEIEAEIAVLRELLPRLQQFNFFNEDTHEEHEAQVDRIYRNEVAKIRCENEHLFFSRYFFNCRCCSREQKYLFFFFWLSLRVGQLV